MTSRQIHLKSIRPEILSAIVNDMTSSDEQFQNLVLRPVIKFQSDLLIEVFKHHIKKHKSVFYNLSLEKQIDYVEKVIQKDMKLRNSMQGIVIGHFTIEEYYIYSENASALNKRIMNIIIERLLSNIQLFEKHRLQAWV